MIRFVSDGRHGTVVGLGLTEGNLQLLARDEPIMFDLADQGLESCMFVIAVPGSAVVAEGRAALDGQSSYVLELSTEQMETLRAEGAVPRELPDGPGGLAQALLIYGETEVHILQAMAESGLMPEGTEVHGVDQYVDDVEQRGIYGDRGVVPTEGSGVRVERPQGDGSAADTARGGPRRTLRHKLLGSPMFWLAMIVVVAGAITVGIQLVRGARSRNAAMVRERATGPNTPPPHSEALRQRLVDTLDPQLVGAIPGPDPCRHEIWVPESVGRRPLLHARRGRSESDRLEHALMWLLDERLMDITPDRAEGIPGIERVIRNVPSGDGWRGVRTYATLVVEATHDATMLGPVGDQTVTEEAIIGGVRTSTNQEFALVPGWVRARLVVWSYEQERFVCASETVLAHTPSFHWEARADSLHDDEPPTLNARLETLIAAARLGHERLRAIPPP